MGLLGLARSAVRRSAVLASSEIVIGEPPGPLDIDGWLARYFMAGIADVSSIGSWPIGTPVPKAMALAVPAVRKGLSVYGILGTFALTKWRAGEKIDPGGLLTQPEDWCPSSVTLAATVRDLVLYPHAWWLVVEREWTGYPRRVLRLDPEYVHVVRVPGSEGVPLQTYATYNGGTVNVADLIRFDGPDDGLLMHGAQGIVTALRLEAAADKASSNEIPEGVIQSTGEYRLEDDEVTKLLDDWQTSRLTRRTAFLDNAAYNVIQHDPRSRQLVEAREASALQISRLMGLPPRYVGASLIGDSMTYSNVVDERRDLLDISLAPYATAIEQRLSMSDRNGSPSGQTVIFDYTSFLRGSPAERTARAATLVPLGVMSRAEARAAEPDLTGPPPPMPKVPPPPPSSLPATPAGTQSTQEPA